MFITISSELRKLDIPAFFILSIGADMKLKPLNSGTDLRYNSTTCYN